MLPQQNSCIPAALKGVGYYTSPIGELEILSLDEKITDVQFVKDFKRPETRTTIVDQCIEELDEYFHRGRKFFTVEVALGGSSFQEKVWNALLSIPYGKTTSYEALAVQLGDIKSIRAVGLANGQNPIAIIVPCHRVIGKNGDLVGYAGGVDKKEWLLEHEGALLKQLSLFK